MMRDERRPFPPKPSKNTIRAWWASTTGFKPKSFEGLTGAPEAWRPASLVGGELPAQLILASDELPEGVARGLLLDLALQIGEFLFDTAFSQDG